MLNNKEEAWKQKLFNVYKKDIRDDLKAKLNVVKRDVMHAWIKKKFWAKMFHLVKYLRTLKHEYAQSRNNWLQSIRRHIASRRIAIHWRRFIYQKGEMLPIRNVMIMRHSFIYSTR